MRRTALLALVLPLLPACACSPEPEPRAGPRYESLVSPAARVVFEGEVLERLPSDGAWCGVVATFQGVRYRVIRRLEGPALPEEVTVWHLLVGPPHCEADEPVLRRDLFAVGRTLRLAADRHASGDLIGHETAGDVVAVR